MQAGRAFKVNVQSLTHFLHVLGVSQHEKKMRQMLANELKRILQGGSYH